MDGFLSIDKPSGVTSFDVVRKVRKLLPRKIKVGHTGTLDPLATGLLILSVGKATRFGEFLLKQDKCYEVTGRLGFSSDTYDVDGDVEEIESSEVSREEFSNVLGSFIGEIFQKPPSFSAIRVNGKRAYEFARKGERVDLPKRKIFIGDISLLNFKFPEFSLRVCCSSGTYVRSLIHDIGVKLGSDAVVVSLRRISIGNISIDSSVNLETLNKENIFNFIEPIESLLPFNVLNLSAPLDNWFLNGRKIDLKSINNGMFSVISENKGFIGVGSIKSGVLTPLKVLSH